MSEEPVRISEMERPGAGKRANDFLRVTFGWLPARVALAGMSFFGFLNLYMVRINLSVIIVAMVGGGSSPSSSNPAACTPHLNTTTADSEGQPPANHTQGGEMEWSETVQGFVLGSFYYGYATTQILGGRAAEMYGTRWVFGGCILSGGLITFLIPAAARLHYGALIALRVVQGVCQGVSWPAMHVLLSRWIPPLERPRFIGYVYFATALSISMTLPLCGLIVDQHGWPAAFYVSGCLSLVWSLAWFTLMYDSPTHHPRISEKELLYIESAIQKSGTSREGEKEGRRSVPWRSVATSLPMWAIIVHGLGNNWGIGLFFNQLPTYMKNILGFSIKANGALSALPFLSRYLGAIVWSSLGDYCTSRGHLSLLASRRIASAISMWIPAVLLICLAYNGCGWKQAVGLMCAALFCNGAISTSYIVNHTDIAPNFAGTLFGVDNTFGAVLTFVVPVVVGVMTDGQQTLGQWRKVFWTCVPMYALTEIFYLVYSSVSVQSWNYSDETKNSCSGHSADNERIQPEVCEDTSSPGREEEGGRESPTLKEGRQREQRDIVV